ncbi:acyl-CoA carboxylase epsilon subunit [Streptomyces sp. NPDC059193]|uniref:acyl-CoA carboxylase epsilon subunit n=1 Tax=Streptomyces sp. NPDC059193 TaxID=3346763 RepID=UPI00368ED508
MIIVKERPLLTAPAVRATPAGDRPATPPADAHRAAADRTAADRTERTVGASAVTAGVTADAAAAVEPAAAAAAPAQDTSLALAMASIRISRGNPTAEEIAALAVLLTARLGKRHEARQSAPAPARTRRLPSSSCQSFRAPGAWAS